MPLPLLGEGREGVFHASLTQLSATFRSAITKIPHPNPVSYTQIPKPLLGDFFELILCFMI